MNRRLVRLSLSYAVLDFEVQCSEGLTVERTVTSSGL